MEILANLFSSEPLVKIMRLFLMNTEEGFTKVDVSEQCMIKLESASVELKLLKNIGFIKQKVGFKMMEEEDLGKEGEKLFVKREFKGWFLDYDFAYLKPLRSLLIENEVVDKTSIASRFRGAGKIKLLVTAGVFIDEGDSRPDFLVVGDNLSHKKIEKAVSVLSSEIGKELTFAIFDVEEFKYRLAMYDKLVCDIFDFKHIIIIETPALSTELSKMR
jgi:hypothetical protein